jgi:hypothetical protein
MTAAELAAFLGMTASGVRNVISRKRIPPIGKRGKANLYDSLEVIRHAGAHDRRVAGTKPESVGH